MKLGETTAVLAEKAIGFFKKLAEGSDDEDRRAQRMPGHSSFGFHSSFVTRPFHHPKCCHSRLRPWPAAANMTLK